MDLRLQGRTALITGGSKGIGLSVAEHFAAELVGRFEADRAALPVLALGTAGATMTAIANDSGFEAVFARQVQAFARPGDVLLAISTSGRSANVIAAAKAARDQGCAVWQN